MKKNNTIGNLHLRTTKAFERIAALLDSVVDKKKHCIRMVDVDRGKVYKSHLGGKLRPKK